MNGVPSGPGLRPCGAEPASPSQAKPLVPDALKRWGEMRNDNEEIAACGDRWARIAEAIGCTLRGFVDDYSASFFTPDQTAISIGPKFRAFIAQGIDAQSGETRSGSIPVGDESPVAESDAPNPLIISLQSEVKLLREALDDLLHALEQEGEHGPAGGSLGCTVCNAIIQAQSALSHTGDDR